MAWRELESVNGRNREATINISNAGKLSWSKVVQESLGAVQHIVLLHDQSGSRLGIISTKDGKGLLVQKGGRSIAAKGTLAAAGLWDKLELPIVGRPALQDQDGVWSISIAPELPIKRRRRAVAEAAPDPDDGEYPTRGTIKGLDRAAIDNGQ